VVAEAYPDAEILSVGAPLYPRFAADVLIGLQDQRRHVYVNPYTLEITGSTSFLNVQRYFRDFHRRFFGLWGAGFYLVCLLSLPLLASLVTGLVFYKRWWRRFFAFRLGHDLRAAMSNLHKLLGLWTLWFLVIIAVTGAWYLAERLRTQLADGIFSYVDVQESAVHPLPRLDVAPEDRLGHTELLAHARQAHPDLRVTSYSPDRGGYFYVMGQGTEWLVRDRANKVFVDPRSGEAAYAQRAGDLSAYWYWSDMADPLHFGDFGGLVSKLVWFVAGLVLAGLCLSGTWVHVKRLQRDAKGRMPRRHAVSAAVFSMAVILISVPGPLFWLEEFGPLVAGQRLPAVLPAGVWGFLGVWGVLTLAICAVWAFYLLQPGAGQRKAGSSFTETQVG